MPESTPITREMLLPLAERHSEYWRIWPSRNGGYACASLVRRLVWTRSPERTETGRRYPYVETLLSDSVAGLAVEIEQQNAAIQRLIDSGALAVAE